MLNAENIKITQKRHLEAKLAKMPMEEYRLLGRNARGVLELFESKPEWSTPEAASALGLNINTAAKTMKRLVDNGYLVKNGITRGAWYTLPPNEP